jgi:dolichyl-phosphate-mannose--protein O-mannosyl transferase
MAKYFQALSISLFGESAFGWRFSSVIFGVGVVWLTFLIANITFKNEKLSLLAAFLASTDGLLLVQSRIAMNDIHVTFFILLSCYWYLHHYKISSKKEVYTVFSSRLILSILAAGLAVSTKWSGVFALGAIGFGEILRFFNASLNKDKNFVFDIKLFAKLLALLFAAIILPAIIYLLSYSQMFLQGKGLSHFVELHKQIWWYQTNLEATHPYQSRPWQWVLNLRPVWYSVDYSSPGYVSNSYALGNPVIFLGGILAVVASIIFIIKNLIKSIKSRSGLKNQAALLLIIVVWYAAVWTPWIFSPRIMFFYHYAPAVPFLAILLAYWLTKIHAGYRVVFVLLAITFFAVWYPNFAGIPVTKDFADKIYFALPSWK